MARWRITQAPSFNSLVAELPDDGRGAPADVYRRCRRGRCPASHPRFPVGQGLSGAAVADRQAVVVGYVTTDPRYLTAFVSTLSEAVVPVLDPATGAVVGTVDVESAERDAFTAADRQVLERCAAALAGLSAEEVAGE